MKHSGWERRVVGPPGFELEPYCGRERKREPAGEIPSHARDLITPAFGREWWAHQDLNLEPTDYESAALTVELWARETQSSTIRPEWMKAASA